MSITELDNPIWYSLNNAHKKFAIGGDSARCYPPEVFRGVGLKENTEEALAELATIPTQHRLIIMNFPEVEQYGWKIILQIPTLQMIYDKPLSKPEHEIEIHALTQEDVPEMLALIELAKPGPFGERTIEMGSYIGIRQNNQLVAMAGSRIFTPHYREISAVCTHPDYRGKGYASLLIQLLTYQFQQEGIIPFLHVMASNENAIRLYEKLGFELHQEVSMIGIRRAGNN